VSSPPPTSGGSSPARMAPGAMLDRASELSARLVLQTELRDAAELCAEAAVRALAADRAYLWSVAPEGGEAELWAVAGTEFATGTAGGPAGADRPGLTGCVAAGGDVLAVADAGGDPRFVAARDDPNGDGAVHWIGAPVPGPGPRPVAVLAAVRAARPAFGEWEAASLRLHAQLAAPVLAVLAAQRGDDRSVFEEQVERGRPMHLYRDPALSEYASGGWQQGDPLDLAARWQRWAFWLLIGLLVVLGVLVVTVRRPVRVSVAAVVLPAAPPPSAEAGLRVRGLVPVAAGRVRQGSPAGLQIAGRQRTVPLTVRRVGGRVESTAAARRLLAGRQAALDDAPWVEVVAAGRLPAGMSPPAAGTSADLRVVVGDEPLLFSLFPALRRRSTGDRR